MLKNNYVDKTQKFSKRYSLLLAPTLIQGFLSFALVPLSTKILDPKDFGIFALISTIGLTTSVLISSGSNYLINSSYSEKNVRAKNKLLISTVVSVIFFSFLVVGTFYLIIFSFFKENFILLKGVPIIFIYLALFEMLAGALWNLAIPIATLNKNVKLLSIFSILRTILRNLSIIFCLYFLHIKTALALFIGSGLSALSLIFGFFLISRNFIRKTFSLKIALDSFKMASFLSISNLLDLLFRSIENSLLAGFHGAGNLGIYSHAQLYPNFAKTILQPAQQAGWPIIRDEALIKDGYFKKSKIIFKFMNMNIILCSLIFALFGSEIISFISNEKFTLAANFTGILIASSSFRHFAGRPHASTLLVNKKVKSEAAVVSCAALAGILINFILVPSYGITGTVIANVISSIVFILSLYLTANRIKKLPNYDFINFFGFFVVLVITLINIFLTITLYIKILMLISIILIYSYVLILLIRKYNLRNIIFRSFI